MEGEGGADLSLLATLASTRRVIPGLSFIAPAEIVAAFADAMTMQLDLRVEAANLNRFRANFASERILRSKVYFPDPIQPFVTDGVLVEPFVSGRRARAPDPPRGGGRGAAGRRGARARRGPAGGRGAPARPAAQRSAAQRSAAQRSTAQHSTA